jgi:AcrR family transcriptional regulator
MTERGPGRPAGSEGRQGREAILKAARELLARDGASRVTLRQVAERAGVRAPLVHYYFGSKAELFEAVMEGVARNLRDQLVLISEQSGSAEDRLRAFVTDAIRIFAADPFAPRLLAELIIFPDDERTERFMRDFGRPNTQVLGELLSEGVASREFEAVDPRMLVPAMMGAIVFYFLGAPGLRRMLDFDPLDPERIEQYSAFVGELLLNGIRARDPEEA